jgi:hypothetical protein
MPALAAIALVWLGVGKPDDRPKMLLAAWSDRHGVALEEPKTEPPMAINGELDAQCEQTLEQARDQATAGDHHAARASLSRLEQTLREHSELPESSWLMAERWRLESQIARSEGQDDEEWNARADALEGSRAAAFGETSEPREAVPKIGVRVTVRGARRFEIDWDDVPSAGQVETVPGEHHLVVWRGSRVGWSGWVSTLTPGAIDLWVRDAAPCTADDLAGVSDAASIPAGIRCAKWALAAKGLAPNSVRVALCRGSQCAPFETETEQNEVAVAPAAPSHGFPAWATWTIAGVGTALATSVVLWRTGVFDRTEPSTRVVYDGSKL